ncbi:MAG: hypothetical protein V4858_27395 [Pseudomonadota bacterium]
MKTTTIAALLLLATLAGTAQAQVRKCILSDGKVTYSDVLCTKDVAKQADVNLKANSVDKSPERAEARKFAMDKLITQARQREPNRCKFSVEPSIQGDGKQLAEAATHECFSNIVAEQTGLPTQNEAFERWFENQQLAEGKRSASIADQVQQPSPDQREKDINCKTTKTGGTCSKLGTPRSS